MPGETHAEQLQRLAAEIKTLGDQKGWLGFLAGLNVGIIILDIILALAAFIAFISSLVDGPVGIALAALLAALAIIVLLLDLLVKWGKDHLEAANDAAYQRLLGELQRKQDSLLKEKAALPGGG
jgi:Ca2+/Na+ antiporter